MLHNDQRNTDRTDIENKLNKRGISNLQMSGLVQNYYLTVSKKAVSTRNQRANRARGMRYLYDKNHFQDTYDKR